MIDNEHIIDNRKVYPITLVWGFIVDDRKVPVVLDHKVKVIEAFVLFAVYKSKEYLCDHTPTSRNKSSYVSFINPIGYTLSDFAKYLRSKGIMWQNVDDFRINEFKHYQYSSTKSQPNSLFPETINESVNLKLRTIYEFFWWAQHKQHLIENRIGHNIEAPISSNIASYKDSTTTFKKDKSAMKTVYPLCEALTAEVGRHRRQHYATDEELSKLRKYYRSNPNVLIAERNVLIVDFIENMGFREGSVASLTTGQFSDEILSKSRENHKKTIEVSPASQKRGYNNQFDTVTQLAIRVNRFVRENRQKMLVRIGKVAKDAETLFDEGNLFISYTTGRPLTAQTISGIISNGFRSIGVVGERAGPHSIRRKFGKDKSSEKHEIRKRNGISTDPADIIMDVAIDLGHSTFAAQNAYNADKRDMYNESIENKLREKNAELEAEITSYRLEAQRKDAYIELLENARMKCT